VKKGGSYHGQHDVEKSKRKNDMGGAARALSPRPKMKRRRKKELGEAKPQRDYGCTPKCGRKRTFDITLKGESLRPRFPMEGTANDGKGSFTRR